MALPFEMQLHIKEAHQALLQQQEQKQQVRRIQEEMDDDLIHWAADPRNFGPDWEDC